MQRRVFLEVGRARARDDGALADVPAARGVRAGNAHAAKRERCSSASFSAARRTRSTLWCRTATPSYYALRPNIAIARPGAADGAIDLDGFFGLHPAMAPLKPLWDRGLLAPVHAVGSPSSTRSHFDAQDYMESGTPDVKGTPDGWLNRLLAAKGTCAECEVPASPFRAVAFAQQTPRIMEGPAPTIAMSSLDDFTIRATGSDVQRLEALYRTGSADLIHGAGAETFDAVKMLKAANPQRYEAEHGAQYPRSPFGQSLRQIAQLVKADVGLEIAFADVGGWDTHVNQGGATGQLANRLGDFAQSIAALVTDLGRPDGRRRHHDDVGVRAHGEAEWQRRNRSRARGRAVRDRRARAGAQGAWEVAGARAGAAERGARSRAHHRLPNRILGGRAQASRCSAHGCALPRIHECGGGRSDVNFRSWCGVSTPATSIVSGKTTLARLNDYSSGPPALFQGHQCFAPHASSLR